MIEIADRALAGIRFEDAATRTPVSEPLHVSAQGLSLYRNHRHIYVVREAAGLEAHVHAVGAAPALPVPGLLPFEVEVRDPTGLYLPRRFTLDLPRVDHADDDDAAHRLVNVTLYRSPLAPSSLHWALVRVRLEDAAGNPVPGLVRVVFEPAAPDEPEVLGMGMSVVADPLAAELARRAPPGGRWVHFDARQHGEVCVPVVGLSSTVWSDGSGTDPDTVTLDAVPVVLEVIPMATAGGLPNPDLSVDAVADDDNRHDLQLRVGQEFVVGPLEVTL
ncbi:MAG: hypothetical protein AAF799_14740 [Myxococcota bacterium]